MKTLFLLSFILCSSTLLAQSPMSHPIFEPELKAELSQADNLFLKAKVTASGDMKGFEPHFAIDGRYLNPTQHWGAENLPVWLQVELPEIELLSKIKMWMYWGDGRIYKYIIEGSVDGKNWIQLVDYSTNLITSDAQGVEHVFEAHMLKYVRINILSNSAGSKSGGHIVEIQGFKDQKKDQILVMAGSVDQRYLKNTKVIAPDSILGVSVDLVAWAGERVNAQFVIKPFNTGKKLRIYNVEKTGNQAENKIKVNPNFVRFVQAAGVLQPDILEDLKETPTVAGEARSVWVTLDVPQNTPTGIYKYCVNVGENRKEMIPLKINLKILSAKLPPPAEWKVMLDLWQTPESAARFHDVKPWSHEHFELLRPNMKRLADAGQKVITTTIMYEAWDQQSYDYLPGMVRWTKNLDGEMEYDFKIFDKWVEFMTNEIGIKGPISCYTMIPWSLKFRYFDEKTGTDVDLSMHPKSKEYELFWGQFLLAFKTHLKEKGWLERTQIGVDERPDYLILPAIEVIKKYAPELRIASAVNVATNKTFDIHTLSPALGQVDPSKKVIEERAKRGLISTFYVCTSPARPNTFTYSSLAESEWLLNYAAANNLDGFLRWAYDNYTENPLKCTDYTKWPTGDCYLVYPGDRSSLRFERFRDGVENFEKINLLRRMAKEMNKESIITSLNDYLTQTYTWQRGKRPENPCAEDNIKLNQLINEIAEKLF